jgi:hypothetical protein
MEAMHSSEMTVDVSTTNAINSTKDSTLISAAVRNSEPTD